MARIPKTVGPYRILELLGRGGMGVVYRAEHRDTGAAVALKTVRARGGHAAIRREIHALARLRHPGIVPIVEEGLHRGAPWYAMELLQGSTLRHFLEQDAGPAPDRSQSADTSTRWWTRTLDRSEVSELQVTETFDASGGVKRSKGFRAGVVDTSEQKSGADTVTNPDELMRRLGILHRLCTPLAFLHGEGLVHRDLKPENIWLKPDGQPVLMDFGIVASFGGELSREQLEIAGGVSGTLAYMAPEQIRGELCDARADLYSLGCLIYEICTGQPPFVDSSPMRVLRSHLESSPSPPSHRTPGLPRCLDELVLRLMEKQPQRRLGYADDVAAALARVAESLGRTLASDAAVASPAARAYLYRPRFVGRERLLDDLIARLGRTEESTGGGVVLLAGESGAGKTRLLIELSSEAHRRGLHVFVGEALPHGGTPTPLGAMRRPLLMLADLCRARGKAETERLLGSGGSLLSLYEPAFAQLFDSPPKPDGRLSAEDAQLHLYVTLAATFEALSSSQDAHAAAVLLVIDDLHWADELTLGFLAYLARVGARLLLVAAYRTEEAGALLGSPLLGQADTGQLQCIGVNRLEQSAVGSIVADMLAMPDPPQPFVRFLTRQSEGNAFFVAEYLRTAIARDVLYRAADGTWQVAAPGPEQATEAVFESLPLPRSIRSLVARRLEGLTHLARRYVQAAAVLGREVEEELPGRMTRLGRSQSMEAARELISRQVMEDAGAGRLRFAHEKVREVTYGGVSPSRLVRLHRSAAEVLEARFGSGSIEHQGALGYHWKHALASEKARPYFLAAARNAAQRYSNAEAEASYRDYLGLADRPSADDVDARNELSAVLRLQGRASEAAQEARASLQEARAIGDRIREVTTLQKLGRASQDAGHHDEAMAIYEEARRQASELGERRLEALILEGMAVLHKRRDHLDAARELYERVLAIEREVGDQAQETVTLSNLALLLSEQGEIEEASSLYADALRQTRLLGHRVAEGNILMNLGFLELDLGNFDLSKSHSEEALAVFREIGFWSAQGLALNNLGAALFNQGELEESRVCYEESVNITRRSGDRRNEALTLMNVAEVHRAQGRPAEARTLLERALSLAREVHSRLREGVACRERATLERLATGDLGGAKTLIEQATSILEGTRYAIPLLLCHCEHGHIALGQGRNGRPFLERARSLAADIRPKPGGEVRDALAQLERAVEWFEAGRPLFRGSRPGDIPAGLRRWLVESGQMAGASVPDAKSSIP